MEELFLGTTPDNKKINVDFSKNPHLLIAGCTGSGKSVLLHTIIKSLLNLPNVKLFLTDTKQIEFFKYKKNKNVDLSIDYNESYNSLEFLFDHMEFRYSILKENPKYNFSNIVFIIDEFSDLIMQDDKKKFFNLFCRLTQKCRAAKIFCVVATQRPSSNLINGNIKANFPARIACKVSSKTDSRIILDKVGAENLKGNGDAIINNYNNNHTRFQVYLDNN